MFVDRKFLIARNWSNRELRKIAGAFAGEVVNVSGWDDRDKEGGKYRTYFAQATTYSRTNYGGHNGFQGDSGEIPLDLVADLPADLKARFDVVFNHTTLEHIFDVNKAFANLCAMSRDVVIVVVPFSQVQHESDSWGDYWRFTPSCLRKLFAANGLEVVYEAESPHKNAAVYLLFVGSRFPERYRGKLPRYRPIHRAGSWIGRRLIVSGTQFAKHRAKQLIRTVLPRNGNG